MTFAGSAASFAAPRPMNRGCQEHPGDGTVRSDRGASSSSRGCGCATAGRSRSASVFGVMATDRSAVSVLPAISFRSILQSLAGLVVDAKYLSDAAHFPGGHAAAIVIPRDTPRSLPSSATPGPYWRRRAVVADRRRDADGRGGALDGEADADPRRSMDPDHPCRSGRGRWRSCRTRSRSTVPGFRRHRRSPAHSPAAIVATNAAGAATFRHGPVRPWVQALTVVLADGFELRIGRGDVRARQGRLAVPTHAAR